VSTANFIERRLLRHFGGDHYVLVARAVEALRERGALWFRVSVKPMSGEVVVEGWRERPPDQGDLPI
jgi:hypothetical protein